MFFLIMPNPIPQIKVMINITKTVFQRGYRLKAPRHALIQTDLVSQNTSANGEKGGHLGEGQDGSCRPPTVMHACICASVGVYVCL